MCGWSQIQPKWGNLSFGEILRNARQGPQNDQLCMSGNLGASNLLFLGIGSNVFLCIDQKIPFLLRDKLLFVGQWKRPFNSCGNKLTNISGPKQKYTLEYGNEILDTKGLWQMTKIDLHKLYDSINHTKWPFYFISASATIRKCDGMMNQNMYFWKSQFSKCIFDNRQFVLWTFESCHTRNYWSVSAKSLRLSFLSLAPLS